MQVSYILQKAALNVSLCWAHVLQKILAYNCLKNKNHTGHCAGYVFANICYAGLLRNKHLENICKCVSTPHSSIRNQLWATQ